jgi:GT2 family glycosyltransferase
MRESLATIAFVPREQFSTTQRSLDTLYQRTEGPFQLVCVDGGSPPAVRRYLERAAFERNFTLIRTNHYLTPNQARNLAIGHVRTPYVVFVDNDVLVAEGWLEPLVQCAQETGAWVVGPLYFEFEPEGHRIHMFGGECRIETLPDGRRDYVERHAFAHQLLSDVTEQLARRETELIEFHSVLVAMEAFRQLGPLDERLMCNAEHGDLCLQVRRAGHRVFLEPRSRITYAPPRRLSGADLKYFRLRWSEAWSQANCRALIEKWGLSPQAPGIGRAGKWVAGHRRYSLSWLSDLRRRLGPRWAGRIERHLIAPWEAMMNRRQYPRALHMRARAVEAKIVHTSADRPAGRAA